MLPVSVNLITEGGVFYSCCCRKINYKYLIVPMKNRERSITVLVEVHKTIVFFLTNRISK